MFVAYCDACRGRRFHAAAGLFAVPGPTPDRARASGAAENKNGFILDRDEAAKEK
jgi:hypothetical protein